MATRRRGRPATNGVKGPKVLARALTVLHAYDRARAMGEKYEVALGEAVALVGELHPDMAISKTEVKRILAQLQPEDSEAVLWSEYAVVENEEARKVRDKFSMLGITPTVEGEPPSKDDTNPKPMKRWTLGIRQRPDYPRHNAKEPKA